MDFNRLMSGEAIVLQGYVLRSDEQYITLQVFPGIDVDIERCRFASLEEATDPVSGTTFVRIGLSVQADPHATFEPRLARLAESAAGGVPFTAGGLPEGVERGPIYAAPAIPGGYGGGGGVTAMYTIPTSTIGTFRTHSYNLIFGWMADDATYSDRWNDQGTPVGPGFPTWPSA